VFQVPETTNPWDDVDHVPGELPRPHIVHRMKTQREQFRHDNTLVPLAPSPEVPTEITATSGEVIGIAAATVFFTTDGSIPDLTAQRSVMVPYSVAWDVHAGYVVKIGLRVDSSGRKAGIKVIQERLP